MRSASNDIMMSRAKIAHPDYDYYIFIRYDVRKPGSLRFKADGSFFNNKAIHKDVKPIFIGMSKKSPVIAREIKRRLLPALEAADEDAKQNYKEAEHYDKCVNEMCWRVINATGGRAKRSPHAHESNVVYNFGTGVRFTAKVYDSTVNIELESLTPDQVENVLKCLFEDVSSQVRKEIGDAVRQRGPKRKRGEKQSDE